MTHRIWAYGSLREGMYNWRALRMGKPITTSILKGYAMFGLGEFPACVKGKGKIVAELFEIDEETFQRIDQMERGANYISEIASDDMLNEGLIYFQTTKPDYCVPVPDGDWVKFVEAERHRYELQGGK